MTSFRKLLILLSACLCAVPGIKAQGSEEDNGGSMEIVSSIHQPQLESNPKTIENPSKTQGDTSNVGGAHLWQSPFETHMTGDPQEMRYGWTYRINNDPRVAATYDGVPNEHFYKKLDADMNSFSPSNSGWDQNLAALNEVDPHMSTKSVKTESMPQKSAIDTAPAKDMKTMKTEMMSTVEKTSKTETSAPAASASQTTKSDPKSAVDTEQTKPKSSETLAKQTQAATVEIPAKQTAPIVNLQQSYQAPLSDIPDLARANAYGTCGSGIIFRQMSEQQPQQGHEQNFYLIPRQQMPMFEQTQNLPHQSIMMQPGLVPLFDQRQQVPAMDQQMAVSDQSQVPQQQSTLMPGKQMMTPEHQMSHEMRTTEERQMPMGTAVQGQEQQQQPQTFNQQLPQQQQPMLIPNQQQQMPMQAPHMPTLDQRQAFPQQQPVHNQQQQMPVQAPPMSILDQRQAFPHQLLLHNQQQQMPMQAPPMPTLDQRQAFPQQLSVHNQQEQMPMQAPPMPTLDQRQSLPQQSLFVPTHRMSDHEMRQMPQQQPMFMPPFNQQQQPAAPSDSQNFKESQIPRWNQQPTFQEQQMWPNWNIFGQRTAVTEDHMLFGKSKPGQQVPGSPDQTPQQNPMSAPNSLPAPSSLPVPNSQSATDPQPSSNVFPPTDKQEMPSQPDIFQEQTHPQPVQNFERQMPFQTLHQSNVALKDGAHDAAKPTMSTLDQGKLDEMRAIMDEMPQARTFKKFKGGIGHTVFVVPGVYGGYAGGYASPAYISPSYSAPIYGSYGHSGHSYGAHLHHGYSPYISEQNPMSKDDSTARENSKGANLQPVAGPLPEKVPNSRK
ncbi:unnamed protein product [Hermetia illucens]|uniref:Uncharacterized protein n=1 Tax=Hermetia illucens TaxID=343691 RepID=A0A7R8V5I5_HERIL|nr:unnamed protein product [Hermetia illucens]